MSLHGYVTTLPLSIYGYHYPAIPRLSLSDYPTVIAISLRHGYLHLAILQLSLSGSSKNTTIWLSHGYLYPAFPCYHYLIWLSYGYHCPAIPQLLLSGYS
jgi:hypothetical protein